MECYLNGAYFIVFDPRPPLPLLYDLKVGEKKYDGFVVRTFVLRDTETKETRSLTHYQCVSLPVAASLPDASIVLKMLDKVFHD